MREWLGFVALLGSLSACGGTAGGSGEGQGGAAADGAGAASDSAVGDEGAGLGAADAITPIAKIDLLLMVDNSVSMSDKQDILSLAVPEIVGRLVNPICVDATGNEYPAPAAGETCPEGQSRQFDALTDINVGVISSSLGDAGAGVACPQQGQQSYRADRVDMAHLLGSLPRSLVQGDTAEGFLAWRPGVVDSELFRQDVQQMVQDVGELGCGWEASLESWYRFLVDPFPYRQLVRVQCPGSSSTGANCVQPTTDLEGKILLDDTLLAQRAAFQRPDSLLVIAMLSDENDCSIRVGNQTWVVVATDDIRPMFRGSSVCASDPNHKCCYACPLGPPAGCDSDPICNADAANDVLQNRLARSQDGLNLRCFDQKRRFGVDFLYPTLRYVNALSQLDLCWSAPDLALDGCPAADVVRNPLYAAWDRRERVFLAGIVGVPWQAIAASTDSSGRPLSNPGTQLRFKSMAEMNAPGDSAWAQILGSPGVAWRAAAEGRAEVTGVPAVPPTLPQMVESDAARSGVADANPINGREYDTSQGLDSRGALDDLQYACIFPLAAPRDCAQSDVSAGEGCDCYEEDFDRPLCEQVPGMTAPGTTQYFAKAYPSVRLLDVLKQYGDNSIVASICARNVGDPQQPDYGYRPAAQAIIERLNDALPAP